MRVKQAIKHLSLLSMITLGISACSSSPVIEEQPAQAAPIILEPSIAEPEEEVFSAVINNGVIDIPILEDAQVFAEFSDSLPAVINYFSHAGESQVIDFYRQAFGEPLSQERKRGRLTLKYAEGAEKMRVVISQQNKKRQVDVMIESNS
ncbi:hypothetical protein AADZ84_01040 [Colwelliaceae bacterium MEBiC 14330]